VEEHWPQLGEGVDRARRAGGERLFKLAPRPGIFTVLDLHKMDVPLIGWELTGVPDSGQRLVGWRCC